MIPTQDSIQEFKVQTSNLGADWGKFSGGVINLSTKSGSNGLHGEAYEYLRNKVLDANDFFLNKAGQERPPFTQNQFGANAGGPLVIPKVYDGRDKTFWFFSWEGFRLRTGTAFTTTVPTPAEQTGDFSAIKTTVMDPCGGTVTTAVGCPGYTGPATPFAGNTIPTGRLNPTSLALLKYFPAANTAGTLDPTTGNRHEQLHHRDQWRRQPEPGRRAVGPESRHKAAYFLPLYVLERTGLACRSTGHRSVRRSLLRNV